MKLNKLIAPSAALAMTVAVVHAQEAGMPGPPGVPAMAQGTMCRAYEQIDGQLAFMKAELRIAPAQEAQWNVFANVFREDKEKQARLCRTAQEQSRSIMSASLPESSKFG